MKNVQCPHCRKTVIWSEDSPYRPFCSKRCRMIDLGAWADGSYSIPASPTTESANDSEQDEALENGSNSDNENEDNEDSE